MSPRAVDPFKFTVNTSLETTGESQYMVSGMHNSQNLIVLTIKVHGKFSKISGNSTTVF